MKKPVKVLLIVVACLFVLSLLKNAIAQGAMAGAISHAAHVPVKIGSVNVSLLSSSIRIKNFRLYNPKGFPEKLMVDVPMIFVDFELPELFKGRARFKEVTLDLKEMVVIKNKDGKLNVDAVKPTEQEKKEAKDKARPEAGKKAPKLLIDSLKISIGRVVYKDYSSGGAPTVQTFDINIRGREFKNIDNPTMIVSLVMFEALTRTTLSRLVSLDVSAFKEGGLQALNSGLGLVGDGTTTAENTAKQLINLFQ
jgi:uncharacterized protein involved in outer membrane biogenesis